MKRVLVTGAGGFLGRHCLPLLAERAERVDAVLHAGSHTSAIAPWTCSRAETGPTWPNVRLHRANLLQRQEVTQLIREVCPTHLLHLAWLTAPGKFWTSPDNFRWLKASLQLAREFQQSGGERLVIAGSCAEYDWTPGVCHETRTAIAPATVYGQAKAALQLGVAALASTTGLSTAWARLFFLYGPGASAQRFPGTVLEALLNHQVARCTHGQQLRDFLHGQDAAAALVRLLETSVTGPINVASGVAVRLADLATEIADRLGRRDLLRLGALPADPAEPPQVVADIARLRGEVRWTPQYDLASGLTDTLAWWQRSLRERLAA